MGTQDLINDIWRTYPWLKDVHNGTIKYAPTGKKAEVEEQFWKTFFMSSLYERHGIPGNDTKLYKESEIVDDYNWLDESGKELGASLYVDDTEPATEISGQTVQTRSEIDSGDKKYLLQNFNKHSMAILGAQFRKSRKRTFGKNDKNEKNQKDGSSIGASKILRRNSVNQASNNIAMSSGSLLRHNRMLEEVEQKKMEELNLNEDKIDDFLCGPAAINRIENCNKFIENPEKLVQDWIEVGKNVRIETDFSKVVDIQASQQVLKHVAENVVVKKANETAT